MLLSVSISFMTTPTEPTRDTWLWGLLAVFLACLGTYSGWTALRAEPAPQYKEIGAFQLTNQAGTPVSREELRGKVWIANFFFTHCSESCPLQAKALQALQERLRRSNVRLVSFSVQPEKDSVERLKAYAETHQANPDRWWFLTGAKEVLHKVALEDFAVPLQENPTAPPGQQVAHKSSFFLVDKDGYVRMRLDREGNPRAGWKVVTTPQERRAGDMFVELPPPGARQFEIDEGEMRLLALAAMELDQAPIPLSQLPLVNALLNSTSAVLLLTGLLFVRLRLLRSHAVCMVGAFLVSAAFLASYLHYHYYAGDTPFQGQGLVRYLYFTILISHVILAIVIVPLILLTFWRAYRRQWARHVALARWTLPLWVYVSLTGMLVYLFLYQWFPG